MRLFLIFKQACLDDRLALAFLRCHPIVKSGTASMMFYVANSIYCFAFCGFCNLTAVLIAFVSLLWFMTAMTFLS
ncbi:MAG: hypothetical protein RSC44_01190 [Clostridia bacterium]